MSDPRHPPFDDAVLHRPVCDLLGCRLPLMLAGMGGVARSELVAAVVGAGGFGFLGMVREPPSLIRQEVLRVRERTASRFGVNLIPAATYPALLAAQIDTCIALRVPVIGLFWDVMPAVVRRCTDAGMLVVHQVGSVDDARQAQEAGAGVLIVQGVEAGGHVRGDRPLAQLLPDVLAQATVPVLAAGGVSRGAEVATLLSLGAQGVVLGTSLIATHESFAHDFHKQRIVQADAGQTVLTDAFHINWRRGARVRVLANSVTRGERGDPFGPGTTVIGVEADRPIHLFSTDSPLRSMTGDFEAMALYAGQGVGGIDAVAGAAERLQRIAAEAAECLGTAVPKAAAPIELSSPVCYAHEFDTLDRQALLASLNELLEAERAGARLTLRSAADIDDAGLRALVASIHRDEVKWCGLLISAIQALEAAPSTRTGAFYGKAMAIADMRERIAFLNRGQDWVVRRLRALLPRVRDERIENGLAEMLAAHERNITRVDARLRVSTSPSPSP